MDKPVVTQAILKEHLEYNPTTGVFVWVKPRARRMHVGDVAGGLSNSGYLQIKLFNRLYLAHRLAWLYMTGEFPARYIDHKNGDPADNSWANLREATQSQNMANCRLSKYNTSGLKGAHFNKRNKRWCSYIRKDERIHLGYFDTAEEAHAAYVAKARELFGEFANAGT